MELGACIGLPTYISTCEPFGSRCFTESEQTARFFMFSNSFDLINFVVEP